MLLKISHITRYKFAGNISHGLQRLRLKPKSTHGQEVLEWCMTLSGAKLESSYDDQHKNHADLVSIVPGTPELTITCEGTVRTVDNNGIVGPHTGDMPLWYFIQPSGLTQPGPHLHKLLGSIEADRSDLLEYLHRLSRTIVKQVKYVGGVTNSETTAEEVLLAGRGVCQDHAHIFIAAGRMLEVPMRYVSGYLRMDARVEQEAGHGWAEAHISGLGWVGFDVSNSISPDERYVRVATGCDYREAAPVTGLAVGAGETTLDVRISVDTEKLVLPQSQAQFRR